jgi:hypothetical protein
VSYGALGTYVTEHALAVAGSVHESYLVGPRDTDDTTAWRTEIGWPVFRASNQLTNHEHRPPRYRNSKRPLMPRCGRSIMDLDA